MRRMFQIFQIRMKYSKTIVSKTDLVADGCSKSRNENSPRKTQLLWRSQTVTSLSAQTINDVVAAAVKELVVVVAAASIAVD